MGFQRRLKILSFIFGLPPASLAVLVAVVVALYPAPSAYALKVAPPTEINYDDPNMATTEGYVAEASIDCIKQGAGGTDVHSCMRGYSKPANEGADSSVSVAQKKDDADLAPSSSDSANETQQK